MIIGKDKIRYCNLHDKNNELEEENRKLKRQLNQGLYNVEINRNLENIVKAILYKFNNYEVEIDLDDIKRVEKGEIYIEESHMKFAKRVKLLFKQNYLKESEDKQ